MDNLSKSIVRGLLKTPDKSIWDFTQNQMEKAGKTQGWSKEQIIDRTKESYNELVKMKYQATDTIKANLNTNQQTVLTMSDIEIRQLATDEIDTQLADKGYTASELKQAKKDLCQQLITERDNAKAYLSGAKIQPGTDMAALDHTDTSGSRGMKEIRPSLVTMNREQGKLTMASSLVVQNIKETFKNPLSAFYFSKERHQRNMAVILGESTLQEANRDMQSAKDQSPIKIASNILSGNTERQDRGVNGLKGIFSNFLSGDGVGSKLIPAIAGFVGGKAGGFGNVTSAVIALVASLVLPMIIRAFNGKSGNETVTEGLANNKDETKEIKELSQKLGRTQDQSIQRNAGLSNNQEIERPVNHNTEVRPLDEKAMMSHVQEKGLCSLRTAMGEKNTAFMAFVEKNNLMQALKQEEINLFNGKPEAVSLTTQALNQSNTKNLPVPVNTESMKTGISLG